MRVNSLALVQRCRAFQWVSVGACGGQGSHKRSFQRYQPDAAAGQPDHGLGRHASFRAAAQAANGAADDPWARLFRKVSVLDDIYDQPDDLPDVEDDGGEDVLDAAPEQVPAASGKDAPKVVEPAAAVEAKPPPVRTARGKVGTASEAVPRRAACQLADAPAPKPVAVEPPRTARRPAPVEVYTAQAHDEAVAGERAQQLALLARLGLAGGADEVAAAPGGVAPPRVVRPVAHGFSSSSEEGDGEPDAADGPGTVQSLEKDLPAPQRAVKPRRPPQQTRAAPVVLADDAAWGRALRHAAGEEVEGDDDDVAPSVDPPPPDEPPRKRRRSRAKAAVPDAGHGDAAPAAPEDEARAARVRQALAATRLGEGKGGVYFADAAFDWRSLAVEAGQQTWSLLGGGAEGRASPQPASAAGLQHAVDIEPMPAHAPPAALPPPQAFKPVDLAALGASFARHAGGAGDPKAAWQAHKDELWADVKRKQREVKRKR